MRIAALGVLAIGLVAAAAGAQQEGMKPKNCDMRKVEDGLWCPSCGAIIDGEEKHKADEATKEHKTEKCKVCVKKYYVCEKCMKPNAAAGKCCGESRKEYLDKSRVVKRCEGCGTIGEKEGACANADCKKMRMKIKTMCEKSGNYPHGGFPPPKE